MEQELSKLEVELSSMETLLHKLEGLTAGPSFKRLGKEIENCAGDLMELSKVTTNITQRVQISVCPLFEYISYVLVYLPQEKQDNCRRGLLYSQFFS